MKNDGGPAFPLVGVATDEDLLHRTYGMSLRDYFAAKAMQGALARTGEFEAQITAIVAYKVADAMLKERNK